MCCSVQAESAALCQGSWARVVPCSRLDAQQALPVVAVMEATIVLVEEVRPCVRWLLPGACLQARALVRHAHLQHVALSDGVTRRNSLSLEVSLTGAALNTRARYLAPVRS